MNGAPKPEAGPARRSAAFALILLLPVPSLGTAASLLWWPELAIGKGVFLFGKCWIALLPLAWLLWVDRDKPGWSPPRLGGFALGAASGLAIAAAILATYWVLRQQGLIDAQFIRDRAARTGLNRLEFYLAGAVYWITLNSLMEEYVWRWFVFRKFEVLLGGPGAVVASALGFTAHHVIALAAQFGSVITVLGSLGVFVGGGVWSFLYLRYRSVWPGYVSHAIVDVPIFLLGYRLIFATG